MKTNQPAGVSFTDEHGANINVPADALSIYSLIKSDQLKVLNRLLSDHAAGLNIKFDGNVVYALAGLASDLACFCSASINSLTRDDIDRVQEKGGAQ